MGGIYFVYKMIVSQGNDIERLNSLAKRREFEIEGLNKHINILNNE